MLVAVLFFRKEFVSEDSSKSAYSEACKWIGKNIVSKKEVEIGEVTWRITKLQETDLPTFCLELYTMIDTELTRDSFCKKCKEFHNLFYVNQQFNCDKCNHAAYVKQLDEKLKIKKAYRKEQLKRILYE